MAVFHVFLLVLVIGIVHHSHGRTYESESITINGSTGTPDVKTPTYRPPTYRPPTYRPPTYKPPKYDYFSLVLQWPKSFCNTGVVTCTSSIPNYFTVHGLWPQLYNGQITTCKSAIKLNYNKLDSSVLNYMNRYWPNLNARHNNINYREWLWDHEYQRHGSCFLPFQTQSSLYFQNIVEMAKRIGNVTDMLLHQGRIRPDNNTPYHLSAFESAISRQLNIIPRLRCNYARGSRFFQLYEIEFCFNRKRALMSCGRNSNCGNSQVQPGPLVMFPRP